MGLPPPKPRMAECFERLWLRSRIPFSVQLTAQQQK